MNTTDMDTDRFSQQQIPRQDQQTRINTIKRKIAGKQARNPAMSFQDAWAELQREAPHLFEEEEDTPTTPSSPLIELRTAPPPTTPFSLPVASERELPPNVTLSEAIKLFRQMTPGQVVQAHLAGMLPDGTPWNERITQTVLSARNPTAAAPKARRNACGVPLPP